MSEARKVHTGPVQDPAHGAHLRHPEDANRHARAAQFHKENGDESEHARSKNLEKWTNERHVHNLKAVAFVDTLGLSHNVVAPKYADGSDGLPATGKLIHPGEVTYNDALNYVAKTLHEKQQAFEGNVQAGKSEFDRAHSHIKHTKGTRVDEDFNVVDPNEPHVDPKLFGLPRDHAAEVIAHLALTKPEHVAAAKALFA